MKIWVYSIQKNERLMAPYFLRHYGSFADKIVIYDGGSVDGTVGVYSESPLVEIRTGEGLGQLDDKVFHVISEECFKEARGIADWVMIVDADEFIWHKSIMEYLSFERQSGSRLLRPHGFNMCGMEIPMDDPRQIYEILNAGVRAPVYSKPIVFDPTIEISWFHGKHDLNPSRPELLCMDVLSELKLLHYRYLTEDYASQRNRRNWDLVPSENKRGGFGWTNNPEWNGEHSPQWVNVIIKNAKNVLDIPNPW